MRKTKIDLEKTIGPEWAEVFFGADGLLYLPGWRRGFTAAELRQQFFLVQERFYWMRRAEQLQRDLNRLQENLETLEHRSRYYRQQLQLESRLGMMLHRIQSTNS
ncbi:MAG: hypothetical protein HKUEN07_03800 [Rhodocyclaceae bacterium]|uniref:Uncharacterized protein n=1 Tax=Candidatus Desulfobacillus denitrificans TaxID=2608985 RepID=A0A809QZN6_9PROT|nr:conserved hypothetical protein [Candidatus Desulfobacillus denitrificans]GIK46181.1 MAG: hypothetical protein BroJett012_20840 [Betaproteobacteria bacterium]GJQ53811.1 MAG: hypothetical protein HKUEN07_03800 [Rhodocyclaceae bacterium]